MKRLLMIGATACALAVLSTLPAAALPAAPPAAALVQSDGDTVLVKGGHGRGHHMNRGNRGRHLGWSRGRHHGWAHARHRGWR